MMNRVLSFLFVFVLSVSGYAQITVDQTFTVEEYVNDILLGTGVQASNITYTGSDVQIGYMQGGDGTVYPMTDGLVLSSEHANNVDPNAIPDVIPMGEEVSGDADLLDIANSVPGMIGQSFSVNSVNDLCILEFDFIATGDTVKFNYSFGSDEYLEWVNSQFNDIFAFFLSGPGITGTYDSPAAFPDGAVNIASVPGTDPLLPITISSVNDILNSAYYIDNVNNVDIAQDGFTVKLEASHLVTCGETYHIKLAIGDGSDTALESIVVLEAGSFTSNSVVDVALSIDVGGAETDIMYEDCGAATLSFTRPIETILEIEEMVYITYQGSAENGVDYTLLPDTIIFEPFVQTVTFELDAFEDGLIEGDELVQFEILNLAACNGGGLTSYFEFTIADFPEPLVVDGYTVGLCSGMDVEIEPIITGGYGNYSYEWSTGEDTQLITVSPDVTTSYNIIVSDTCGMPSDDADIIIEIAEFDPLEISIDQGDIELGCNGSINLTATTQGGDGNYEWSWEDQDGMNLWGWENTLWYSTWQGASQIAVVVEDGCGFVETDIIDVSMDIPELFVELESEMTMFCNEDFTLDPDVTGGEAPYFYNWYVNGMWVDWAETYSYSSDIDVTISVDVQDNCGQTETIDVQITIVSPEIEIVMDDTFEGDCSTIFNLTPEINGGSGGFTYAWSEDGANVGSQANLDFQSDVSTTLDFTVNDQCGETASAQVDIVIDNPEIFVELGDGFDVTCIQEYTLDPIVSGGVEPLVYTWSDGVSTISNETTITNTTGDDLYYLLTITDQCGTSNEDDITVLAVNPPPLMDLGPDVDASCLDTTYFVAQLEGGIPDYEFQWSVGGEVFSISNYANFQSFETVDLQCEVIDACGATTIETVTVNIPDIPLEMTLSADTLICRGSTIPLIAQASGGEEGITYSWDPVNSNSWNIQVSPGGLTSYSVTATDVCGQSLTQSVMVDVQDVYAAFDVEYLGANTVQFIPDVEMVACDSCFYVWDFGDGTSSNEDAPAHIYTQLDQFFATLTVVDSIGCADSFVKLVNAPVTLFVPNAFTPDGDGINEVWQVVGSGFYQFEVFVFNRWGDQVFSATDPDQVWTGEHQSGEYFVPDGVYSYIIKYMDVNRTIGKQTGHVTIIR